MERKKRKKKIQLLNNKQTLKSIKAWFEIKLLNYSRSK